ncbi:MAG: hypothetical protein ABI542_05095 [Gemmatimonadota bacterium]
MMKRLRSQRHTTTILAFGAWCAACGAPVGPQEVLVEGTEYTFHAPDSLAAGPTAFAFTNRGRQRHEVKIVGLKAGVTMAQVQEAAKADLPLGELTEPTSGILTAGPGATTPGRILVTLHAGRRYVLVCGFQDTEDAPTHDQLGMVHEIRVY